MPNIENLGRYDSGFSFKKILFWFILVVIFVSLGTLYFVLSKAIITLHPKIEEKEVEGQIVLNENFNGIDHEQNMIHGVVISAESMGTKTYNDLPLKRIEENAKGKLIVKNNYSRAIRLDEGDVLISKNSFGDQKVVIEETTIIYRNQTKEVPVFALVKGVAGHLEPMEFRIEKYNDYMNEKVSAKTEEPLKGGIREARLLTQTDLEVAKSDLLKDLVKENILKMKDKLREGEELSRSILLNNVLEFNSSVNPPIETDGFSIMMKLKTEAPVFQKSDLYSIVEKELKDQEVGENEFLSYNKEGLEILINRISPEEKKVYLDVKVIGKYKPKLSSELLDVSEIKGYNRSALKNYYENFEEIESFDVEFWPNFRKTVPEMEGRIVIQIKQE